MYCNSSKLDPESKNDVTALDQGEALTTESTTTTNLNGICVSNNYRISLLVIIEFGRSIYVLISPYGEQIFN